MNQTALIIELIEAGGLLEVDDLNAIRAALHKLSPFQAEPVDFVRWVPIDRLHANDYNPNEVAPPEMELLRVSIRADGYTQPIVTMPDADTYEVVDGFHRHRVGRETKDICARIRGYLPVVAINQDRFDKADRMAATIRHNRARGKHKVDSMSEIVIELKRRNWSDEKISKNLGMDPDEVLRLCQITGLSELFTDQEFSKSWDVEDVEDDFIPLTEGDEAITIEPGRILHTWDKWECFPAGFYETRPPEGMTKEMAELTYMAFLHSESEFENAICRVIFEWPNSCQHYLTNERMNRLAWLGQAACCIAHGIPQLFCGGFNMLTEDEQNAANAVALKWLNVWLKANDRDELTPEKVQSKTEANLY